MKKLVFFITATLIFFSACQKENITPVDFNEINDIDTTTHTDDTTTHVYDTVQSVIDTVKHVWVDEVLTRSYNTTADSENEKVIVFEISFTLHTDGEIYFDKDQMREIVGLSDTAYNNKGIHSFVSGYYTMVNGMYKITKDQPQYIALSLKISRNTSATVVPIHMLVQNFDYRTLKNGQFKAQTVAIGLKTDDVMF